MLVITHSPNLVISTSATPLMTKITRHGLAYFLCQDRLWSVGHLATLVQERGKHFYLIIIQSNVISTHITMYMNIHTIECVENVGSLCRLVCMFMHFIKQLKMFPVQVEHA